MSAFRIPVDPDRARWYQAYGFHYQDVNVSGENGTIQYYLNDAPIQSNLAFQALYDVSSINEERGPQGTRRGRSTPSGAINITTHLPDLSAPGGYVSGTVGDHSVTNNQFGIGTPIIADKLAVRISGLQEENDAGGIRQFGTNAKGFARTRAIRALPDKADPCRFTLRKDPSRGNRLGPRGDFPDQDAGPGHHDYARFKR